MSSPNKLTELDVRSYFLLSRAAPRHSSVVDSRSARDFELFAGEPLYLYDLSVA
ncbi:hypothetical protein N8T08_005545 [Aspergillus melleus]|uniref:Uncharacterized protein n=1 Tax=Aspergillus melleus TaxID=138277 RepID=A0ACC3B2M8_9EURO|nr:hypothetical protein N8T08_005545 [Aspergillus melleus]